MQDYMEKRDFPRMVMGCPARYRLDGSTDVATGITKDLSGSGLLLQVQQASEPGSLLAVEIRPGKNITPPLHALAKVNRCDPAAAGETGFYLACRIDKLLSEDEVPLDFP